MPYPMAKFYFIWSIQPTLIVAGNAEVGHNSRNESPASVMVNGEKANTDDKLLYTSPASMAYL